MKTLNYMGKKALFAASLIIMGLIPNILRGNTYYAKANGNWNSAATWGTACGSGTGAVPTATDNIVICSPYTVTVNGSFFIAGVTVSGGTLNFSGAYTLSVGGNATFSGGIVSGSGTNIFSVIATGTLTCAG